MAKGKKVFSAGEVAEICNIATRTVHKWFDSGLLGGYRIPSSGDRRIPVDELLRFMKQYSIPVPEELRKLKQKKKLPNNKQKNR